MNPNIKLTDFGVYVMKDDTHLSRWVENDRRLDHARHELDQFRRFIPEGGTVIDCGTSIGDHTETYATWVGPKGTVIGFEANPDVAECCALNFATRPWVKIHNIGLSNDFGAASINLDPNVGASHLSEGKDIKLAPLDSFMDEMKGRCDFIKVDIEGYEPRMIAGAMKTITTFKPAILMEVNKGALERQGYNSDILLRQLRQLGYEWKIIGKFFSNLQYDVIATPRNVRQKSS